MPSTSSPAQAHLVVAAIEFAGDQPRDGWIGGVIGIEQQQAIEADPGLPAAQPDLQPRQLYGQPQRRAAGVMQRLDGHLPGVVDRIQRLLSAVRADALAEVAVLPEHAHRGDRHAEVAGGLELVPGDVAEAAGIDRQGFAEHVFHGKVDDSREAFAVLLAGEPVGCSSRAWRALTMPSTVRWQSTRRSSASSFCSGTVLRIRLGLRVSAQRSLSISCQRSSFWLVQRIDWSKASSRRVSGVRAGRSDAGASEPLLNR